MNILLNYYFSLVVLMSWIPGISSISNWLSNPIPNSPIDSALNINQSADHTLENSSFHNSKSLQTIDPTGFERAAKAIKEINQSPHASKVLDVTFQQEKSRQKELDVHHEQLRLNILHEKSAFFDKDHEAKARASINETEQRQKLLQYQDQLERRRAKDNLIEQKRVHLDNLRTQEESILKQESTRRATVEYENKLRADSDLSKIRAEIIARGDAERNNQDLTLEQIRLKETEHRRTLLLSINEVSTFVSNLSTHAYPIVRVAIRLFFSWTVQTFCQNLGMYSFLRSYMVMSRIFSVHIFGSVQFFLRNVRVFRKNMDNVQVCSKII